MQADLSRSFHMTVHGDEVDSFKEIVLLAAKQLRQSPSIQLKGSPMKRQAGLVGTQLIEVKDMLEKLAAELGEPINTDPPPADSLMFIGALMSGNT